jgi:hypothetical protein
MMSALPHILGRPSTFHVLKRKPAKTFRIQYWIMFGQLHLFAPESLVFFINANLEQAFR